MHDFTIVCPYCYNEAVHTFSLSPGPNDPGGSTRLLCDNCFKKFRIYFQGGKISGVKKT
jgi:hypothetical protein